MRHFLLVSVLLICCAGCEQDARIKRQASLLNTKTQVVADEYQKADTPAKKQEIADEYFRTTPKMTQVLEDYMFGREPKPDTTVPPTPAPAK